MESEMTRMNQWRNFVEEMAFGRRGRRRRRRSRRRRKEEEEEGGERRRRLIVYTRYFWNYIRSLLHTHACFDIFQGILYTIYIFLMIT